MITEIRIEDGLAIYLLKSYLIHSYLVLYMHVSITYLKANLKQLSNKSLLDSENKHEFDEWSRFPWSLDSCSGQTLLQNINCYVVTFFLSTVRYFTIQRKHFTAGSILHLPPIWWTQLETLRTEFILRANWYSFIHLMKLKLSWLCGPHYDLPQ